jgi:HPt (histidine-containing phosphotransfer) domain-containing protein
MFIDQGDELLIEITDALVSSDIERLGSLAHKFKGSALNLGAEIVAETCRKIELKGREKDASGMEELVKKLTRDFSLTKEQLISILK